MSSRPSVYVHSMPSMIPPEGLRGRTAVVFDVLRATTVMAHALDSGCRAIVPCQEVEEAFSVAAKLPDGTVILGGERGGVKIDGFHLGNSPESYTPDLCRGRTLVMTTTNGTQAIWAARDASRLLVAAFVNVGAVAAYIKRGSRLVENRNVHLVCAGTDGRFSLEDFLAAGALIDRLLDGGYVHANDEAIMAHAAWSGMFLGDDYKTLEATLKLGLGGRNVVALGLEEDVWAASRIDRFKLVGVYDAPASKITRAKD